ncbi:MAG: (Fe-S)-binding protein [Trueperaceae bacterium]
MQVSLFVPCYVDTLYPEAAVAMTRVLERVGLQVDFPAAQTCCGQMHFNTGYQQEALTLARRFVEVFAGGDAVVAPSASCVGMVREFYPYLARQVGDEELVAAVEAVGERTFELSEFLVGQLGVEDVGAYYPHRVTYHPTCHSLRAIRVGDAPLKLLRAVRGIEIVQLPDAETCCGFGGTFAVKNSDTSMAMLSDKVANVLSTKAEACVAADNSCLMHIGGALSRGRTGVRAVHLAEILASTMDDAAEAPADSGGRTEENRGGIDGGWIGRTRDVSGDADGAGGIGHSRSGRVEGADVTP